VLFEKFQSYINIDEPVSAIMIPPLLSTKAFVKLTLATSKVDTSAA